jgi:hypothetical protein
LFAKHHYLSHNILASARCFTGWIGDEIVGFVAHVPFPHPKTKNIRMYHRCVILPDYQGFGIGICMSNWLGQHLHEQGYRLHSTVAHPGMIKMYETSPRWKALYGGKETPTKDIAHGNRGQHMGSRVKAGDYSSGLPQVGNVGYPRKSQTGTHFRGLRGDGLGQEAMRDPNRPRPGPKQRTRLKAVGPNANKNLSDNQAKIRRLTTRSFAYQPPKS